MGLPNLQILEVEECGIEVIHFINFFNFITHCPMLVGLNIAHNKLGFRAIIQLIEGNMEFLLLWSDLDKICECSIHPCFCTKEKIINKLEENKFISDYSNNNGPIIVFKAFRKL